MRPLFDHEKLKVYQFAIEFVAWCGDIIARCTGAAAAKKHLDEASTSIANNIAEGNGQWSRRDRRKSFEVARGEALECAACLDVLVARKRLDAEEVLPGKEMLHGIVAMLTRMVVDLSEEAER
jgi:four helix bundle protein